MRRLPIIFLLLLAVTGCKHAEEPSVDQPLLTAEGYYNALLTGNAEAFASGVAGFDAYPAGYRAQLVTNARQFLGELRSKKGGVEAIRGLYSEADSTQGITNAFLLLTFADSTQEKIVVPMMEIGGQWMMR